MKNAERLLIVVSLALALRFTGACLAGGDEGLVPKTGFIEVEGGKLYFEEAGEGPAVVLVHDGMMHSEIWDAQFRELAKAYRVIRYDRRGYGRSLPQPTAPYSTVDDLDAVMKARKVARATLFGSSAGGGLTIDYTLNHPDKVNALVLCGAVVNGLGYSAHMMRRARANFGADMDTTIELWVNDRYSVAPGNDAARGRVRELLKANPHNLDGQKHQMAKLLPYQALDRLSEISVPTLLIIGDADIPDVHAHAGAIEAGIPSARRKIISGAGHLVYLEQPEAFNAAVLEFLSLISLKLEWRLAKSGAWSGESAFKRGLAKVGSTSLYYETLGEGTPIVMVHGGSVDHRMWDDQFEVFAKHCKVIRYDAQGHGATRFGAPDHKPHDDLRDLLDHLGIERAHVMGLSMGGRIVVDFAVEHPSKVLSLIPVAPGLSGYDFLSMEIGAYISQIRSKLRKSDQEGAADVFLRWWCIGPDRKADDMNAEMLERVRAMLVEGFEPGKSSGEGSMPDPPAIGRLSEIRAPTLIIVGDKDVPDILDIGNILEAGISKAKKVVFSNAAHMVNMEQPEKFNRVVLDFLREY